MKKKVEAKLQLLANRLMTLKEDKEVIEKFSTIDTEEAQKMGFYSRDFGMNHWDWPQGIGIYGLHSMEADYSEFIKRWALSEIKKGLPTKNINTTCPLLTLMDFPEFEDLSLEWIEWVEKELPRTMENGFQHVTTGNSKDIVKLNDQQIWIDTLFMTILFEAKMGVKYNSKRLLEDATYQVLLHTKYLLDRESGLFYHGWNFTDQSNYGGIFWCRGNSWFCMGLPIFLEIMKNNLSVEVRNYLVEIYKNQVHQLMNKRSDNLLWHTVIDDKTSYHETSGSAGIVAGVLLGISYGILNKDDYLEFCEETISELLEKIDEEGTVHGVSAGTNISNSKDDYKKVMTKPMAYGQAMTMFALSNYLNVVNNISDKSA